MQQSVIIGRQRDRRITKFRYSVYPYYSLFLLQKRNCVFVVKVWKIFFDIRVIFASHFCKQARTSNMKITSVVGLGWLFCGWLLGRPCIQFVEGQAKQNLGENVCPCSYVILHDNLTA